ncbi:MAG: shikimate kinase [Clostridium sp.]|nr:shikimate kinase [Clostridium sp.]
MGKSNIVLIGMPSSGKTTIGKPLSLALGMDFIDTDNIIIAKENKELKDIVNQDGLKKFLEIQEKSLLELHLTNYVISTGGSVIYNKTAMEHLKNNGMVFYLRLTLDEIKNRLGSKRRLARNVGQTFADVYKERTPLYEGFADITIDCNKKNVHSIVQEITDVYTKHI